MMNEPLNRYALGNNLIRIAKARHMSQKSIAERIGIHPNTLYRWTQGNINPNAYDLYRVAKVLDTTMDELMKGVDDG